MSGVSALLWLNFFIADVMDGLGPFLGVFLKIHNFGEGEIGFISTTAQLSALIFAVPLGILVDKTPFKKHLIALCIFIISVATLGLLLYPNFIFAITTNFAIAIAAACLAPSFAAITLGIVGAQNYKFQVAKNEAFKHAGTVFGAALSFIFALYYGIVTVFIITIVMAGCSLIALNLIKSSSIDNKIACGDGGESVPLKAVFKNRAVLILAFAAFCFHASNAYMLPLLSQRAATLGVDSSGAYAALTIIIAQITMIAVCIICTKSLRANLGFKPYFWLFGASFAALILRGLVAANSAGLLAMIFVQILDGVGAGVIGVILPILVAIVLRGSGHINAGLTFIISSGGVGAALSASIGGVIAQYLGYAHAYAFLALIALLGLMTWFFSYSYFDGLGSYK